MESRTLLNQSWLHVVILLVLICSLYSNSLNLGFFSDDYQGIEVYNEMKLSGFDENFRNPFFMPFSFLFQSLELLIFGDSYFAIKIVNIIFFFATSVLLYSLSRIIVLHLRVNSKGVVIGPLMITILFITSPYQTETINWFSSQAYLLASFFSLIALNSYLKYRQTQRVIYLYIYLAAFFIAILNKEIALIIPIISLLLGSTLFGDRFQFKRRAISVWIILSIYLILRYVYLGELVGGYGTEVHLNTDLKILANSGLAYIAKFFLLYRYLPQGAKMFVVLLIPILLLIVGIRPFMKQRKVEREHLFLTALFISFLVSILPVINLEMSFLGEIQSDRYGYLPSIFFSLFLGFFLMIFASRILLLITIPITAVFMYFTVETNSKWIEAAEIRDNFISAVNNLERSHRNVIINLPDTYEGIYLFRHGLKECVGFETTNSIKFLYSHALMRKNSYDLSHFDDGTFRIKINNGKVTALDTVITNVSHVNNGSEVIIDSKRTENNPIYYFDNSVLVRVN